MCALLIDTIQCTHVQVPNTVHSCYDKVTSLMGAAKSSSLLYPYGPELLLTLALGITRLGCCCCAIAPGFGCISACQDPPRLPMTGPLEGFNPGRGRSMLPLERELFFDLEG